MSPSRAFSPWVGAHPFAAQPPTAGSNLVGNPKPMLKTGIAIAAMLILMVPLVALYFISVIVALALWRARGRPLRERGTLA